MTIPPPPPRPQGAMFYYYPHHRSMLSTLFITSCCRSKVSFRGNITRKAAFSSNATISSKEEEEGEGEVVLDRVKIQRHGNGICHVRLDRPKKLNALDLDMFKALSITGQKLQKDHSLRVVILSGTGRAFCTGLDVPSFVKEGMTRQTPYQLLRQLLDRTKEEEEKSDGDEATATANLAQELGYQWRQLPVPVIACLHGMCLGGGMQIALGADFRFATPSCELSIMESKWGLIPDMSASVTLRELVSIDVAKELTMTGKIITGNEASQLNLVTRVVSDPIAEAHQLAQSILERSPDSIALSKQLYQSTWTAVSEDYCLKVETELQRQLLFTWNQMAASGRAFGWKIPYFQRTNKKS